MLKDIYTVKDIAEQMQVEERTVRRHITDGDLEAQMINGKYFVLAQNLQAFVSGGKGERKTYGKGSRGK